MAEIDSSADGLEKKNERTEAQVDGNTQGEAK
jgi:hypothetical protein